MVERLCVLFFLFVSLNCYSRNEQIIDSLYTALDEVKEDSLKVTLYEKMTQDLIGNDWVLLNKIFQRAKPALEKFPEKYYDALSAIAWTGVLAGEFEKTDSIHAVLLEAYKHQPFKQKQLFLSMAKKNYLLFKLAKADSLLNFSFKEEDDVFTESIDLHKQLYRTYNFRGAINNVQGKFLDADKNLKISLKYAEKADKSSWKVAIYANLFYANFEKGNINESLKYLQKSFNAYLKNTTGKIPTLESYITLLDFYTDVGLKISEEEQLFERVQTYIEETGADYLEFDFNLILLKKYLNQKDVDRSADIINQLKKFLEKSDVRLYLSRFYDAQIKYYLLIDNKVKAQEIIDNLYAISIKQGLKNYEALSLIYQTEIDKEDTKGVITNLEKAYELAEKYDNLRIKKLSLEKLVPHYQKTEAFQKTAMALQEIITLDKSLVFNQDGLNTFSQILNQVQGYLDGNAPTINIQPLKEQNKSTGKNLYIFLGLLSFLVLYVLYHSNKKSKQRKHLGKKLKQEHAKRVLKDRTIKYNKLKVRLLSSEITWTEFIHEYEILFPDFMEKLKSLDINLTKNTLINLLCVKMELNSKETATLNGVSVDAINKAKYRIKKQLKLDSSTSLTDYIQGL